MSAEAYSEESLRERFEEVVVSTNGKNTKKLHLPSEEGDGPLCEKSLQKKEWRVKSLGVYPPGWFDGFCSCCVEELREREEAEEQEAHSPIKEHGVCEGAATSDWAEG